MNEEGNEGKEESEYRRSGKRLKRWSKINDNRAKTVRTTGIRTTEGSHGKEVRARAIISWMMILVQKVASTEKSSVKVGQVMSHH